MKYLEFKKLVTLPIFTSQDLKNLGTHYTPSQLTGWLKLGYLTKLRGGLYAYTDSLGTLPLQVVANSLHSPSYLSLSYALSHYGVIPEAVYIHTSVTSKTTRTYNLPIGNFTYQHLPPRLIFGYNQISDSQIPYLLAEPEKALLDYFYLTPSIKNSKDIFELRLNLESINWLKLNKYLTIFKHVRLNYLIKILEDVHAHN
jgi:predicted transcriptional regulator of viral defense system